MAYTPTGADALQWTVGGTEIDPIMTVGTLPGVTIEQVGGILGEGTSRLRFTPGSPGTIALAGPADSGVFGTAVAVGSDDTYLIYGRRNLLDAAWMRVSVLTAFLPVRITEVEVFTKARFNALGLDDVTAGEATAGDVSTFTMTGTNESAASLIAVRVWIQSGSGLEVSDDGVTWVTPSSTLDALLLASILASAGTVTLHIRRTISAGATADPKVTADIRVAYYEAL